jgi:hypothetical protein
MQIDYLAKSYTLTENINRGKRIPKFSRLRSVRLRIKTKRKKEKRKKKIHKHV